MVQYTRWELDEEDGATILNIHLPDKVGPRKRRKHI